MGNIPAHAEHHIKKRITYVHISISKQKADY